VYPAAFCSREHFDRDAEPIVISRRNIVSGHLLSSDIVASDLTANIKVRRPGGRGVPPIEAAHIIQACGILRCRQSGGKQSERTALENE
jgi:hypothetical protein